MANPNNPVFEIDAGKILAKLHLAGQQQLDANKIVIINTGIINPVEKADPANPGKVEFDLNNKKSEYQFAVLKLLKYKIPIDLNKNKIIINLQNDISKVEPTEETGLLDGSSTGSKHSETYKARKALIDALNKIGIPGFKPDVDNFKESVTTQLNDAIKKENDKRNNAKETAIKKIQKFALDDIKTYFKTVAGEKNAAKIKESELVPLNADIPGKLLTSQVQFNDIKNYKILPNIDKAIQEYEANIQKNAKLDEIKNGPEIERNIMFVVGFNVETETV